MAICQPGPEASQAATPAHSLVSGLRSCETTRFWGVRHPSPRHFARQPLQTPPAASPCPPSGSAPLPTPSCCCPWASVFCLPSVWLPSHPCSLPYQLAHSSISCSPPPGTRIAAGIGGAPPLLHTACPARDAPSPLAPRTPTFEADASMRSSVQTGAQSLQRGRKLPTAPGSLRKNVAGPVRAGLSSQVRARTPGLGTGACGTRGHAYSRH